MTGREAGCSAREDVRERASYHLALLDEGLRESCNELTRFQSWIAKRMRQLGLEVMEFRVDPEELVGQPAYQRTLASNATELGGGPNIVGTWPGEGRDGVLLFAHADKSPETLLRGRSQPRLVEQDGRLLGPGIADDVSGVTAMLSAVETCRRQGLVSKRRLLVASHLGKQLGVMGTHGLMRRFDPLDHAIYSAPCGEWRRARGDTRDQQWHGRIRESISRANLRNRLIPSRPCMPIRRSARRTRESICIRDSPPGPPQTRSRHRKTAVEGGPDYPFALLLSRFEAGADRLAYEVPLHCRLQGTVCFPPSTTLSDVQAEFERALDRLVEEDPWLSRGAHCARVGRQHG